MSTILFASVGPNTTAEVAVCCLATSDESYAERVLRRWAAESDLDAGKRCFGSAIQRDFLHFVHGDQARPIDLTFLESASQHSELLYVRCNSGGRFLVSREPF